MLEVQSLYKPTPPHQPTAKRRRLRLTSVPLVDLRAPPDDSGSDINDLYGSLNSPPRSLTSDVDTCSLSTKSGICSVSESMDSQRLGTSSIRIKHLTSSWESESRFPKLNECAHFHYEFVELGPIDVCLFDEVQENSKLLANGDVDRGGHFGVQVACNGKSWVVRRTYENFHMLDRQLHQCIYDRKFSALPEIPKDDGRLEDGEERTKEAVISLLTEYLQRFSVIAGNLINCGPILNWLELDNRGNRLIVTDDSAINTPAVAAAYVTKRYIAQAADEISFEVCDMISVIDMPPPEESIWWRGKRGFEVGFFPSECVEVIGDKVPPTIHIPKAPTKPVLRKHGKLIAFFRSFILSRPSRRKLKQSGILKERVFGCDLGEHLLNSGHEIPMVLKCCADFIEDHGIVDGIYRLSGVTSNIQKLRNTFDEDRVPDLNDEAILQDIHSVASLLKMYFRELPNPLLTYQLYDKFVFAVQSEEEVRLLNIRDVVQQLPPPHYRTLEYLVKHLTRVASHGVETGMTPKNVAIVWAPNLLRSKDLEVGGVAALQVVGVQAVVTEFLIRYSDLIFNDKMPVFPPCPGSAGTPKRNRPKSLAISTPTKLLSLEEARSRALASGTQCSQKYIEVGGGPATLPSKYHTVIDLPDRKRGTTKHKKSPSGWKSFFGKGKSSQSTRDREKSKSRRKASATPSDPGISVHLSGKAVTETDVSYNNNRLRSVKSAESLVSSSTTSSHRNSSITDSGSIGIPTSGHNGKQGHSDSENILSSSLGAVPTSQLRQSPHSHIRSISHDSYFEYALERRREERPTGELSTIMSEDNDEDSEKLTLDDFQDVARDLDLMKLHYMDQETDISVMRQLNDGTVSTTLEEITTSLTEDLSDLSTSRRLPQTLDLETSVRETNGPDTLGSESLQEQLSLDFEDGHCDIVGDIQKEVAAALHWDQAALSDFADATVAARDVDKMPTSGSRQATEQSPESNVKDHSKSSGKVVVERYGSEKTVIVEVHATEESSAEEEEGIHAPPHQHSCKTVVPAEFQKSGIGTSSENKDTSVDFSALPHQLVLSRKATGVVPPTDATAIPESSVQDSRLFPELLETKDLDLVNDHDTQLQSDSFPDSLEYSNLSYKVLATGSVSAASDDESFLDSLGIRSSVEEPVSFSETTFEHRPVNLNVTSSTHVLAVNDESSNVLSQGKAGGSAVCSQPTMPEDGVQETVPKIFVRESTLPVADEQSVHPVAPDSLVHSVGLEPSQFAGLESDSSPGSQATSYDEVSSNTSPSGTSDLFGYSVLMNEEEATQTHAIGMLEVADELNTEPSLNTNMPTHRIKVTSVSKSDIAKEMLSTESRSASGVIDRTSTELAKQSALMLDVSSLTGDEIKNLPEPTKPPSYSLCPLDAEISAPNLQSPISPCRESELYSHPPKSCFYPEKLSPVSPIEESKRKFESEIGRDILRERKLKLELEKIQLEHQKLEKVSPCRTDELPPIPGISSSKTVAVSIHKGDTKSPLTGDVYLPSSRKSIAESDISVEHVELRQVGAVKQEPHSQEDLLKRLSDPVLSTTIRSLEHPYPLDHSDEGKKRNSEPPPLPSTASKCSRPERKASVRELMSKFEGRPKVEVRMDHKEDMDLSSPTAPISTSPSSLSKNMEQAMHFDGFAIEANQSRVSEPFQNASNDTHDKLSASLSSAFPVQPSAQVLVNQAHDMNHTMLPASECGTITPAVVPPTRSKVEIPEQETKDDEAADVPKVTDVARRERIDRYKEERRAQLRERIKSESFRGEQDNQSEYLVRLKMKASSPTKLVGGSSEDISNLPVSPVRRARLSSASLASPTEVEEKMDVFLGRRRSFNTRSGSGALTSPSGSEESKDSTPPVSPRKVAREKRCGLPIPPSSPKKGPTATEAVDLSDGIAAATTTVTDVAKIRSGHEPVAPSSGAGAPMSNIIRPKDLFVDKRDSASTRKSSFQRKESPVDNASKRLKSPMKERTSNLPPSPTKDKFNSSRSDHPSRKDIKNKTSPVTENLPTTQTSKSKIPKSVAPVPGPRKIKEVAALFEPDVPVSSGDQSTDIVSAKPRPLPKPSAGILQRQLSLNANEVHDSSSLLSSNQRWKPKHPSGP